MAQEPVPPPFKVQKECKRIFITYIYLQTCISTVETKITKVKTDSQKCGHCPPISFAQNTFNATNHQPSHALKSVHLKKKKQKTIKTSFPLFSGSYNIKINIFPWFLC